MGCFGDENQVKSQGVETSSVKKKRLFRARNESGQMAIFLVLIFQLLFVFFAMSINVGLVVHDKINLQNSVDLGAYYAAAKQAEMLNQVAHINYQMRQAFKLLAFRIRVVGSMAIGYPEGTNPTGRHPTFKPAFYTPPNEAPYFSYTDPDRTLYPAVCIGANIWHEYYLREASFNNSTGLCRDINADLPVIGTSIGGGGPLGGLFSGLGSALSGAVASLQATCRSVAEQNFKLASRFLMAYRLETLRRSEMIDELAARISEPGQQMRDFNGQSIYEGVRKTIERNLTEAQRGSLQVTLQNSLSPDMAGDCSNPSYWLPKIEILPRVSFIRLDGSTSACSKTIIANPTPPNIPPNGADFGPLLNNWQLAVPNTYGYEKNPWCMPYVFVRATTQPRQIFAPLGQATSMQAVSYAKPFGGRIGPWYGKTWPQGNTESQAGAVNERIDPLLPTRYVASAPIGTPSHEDTPNFSKYPGDLVGMNSRYLLSSYANYFFTARTSPPSFFSMSHYRFLGDSASFDTNKDSLAQPPSTSSYPLSDPVRKMELTAVAPDLFDITYYSIESEYYDNFLNADNPLFNSALNVRVGDIGAAENVNLRAFSVATQISEARSVSCSTGNNCPFYMVDNPQYLLTGWDQERENDYNTFPSRFGRCIRRIDAAEEQQFPAPGGCIAGGRTGYSVKTVSKDYLQNSTMPLGGPGIEGNIENPPN